MFYSSNQIKNQLLCQICKEIVSDPRVLPCGRTFCNNCVTKSDDNNFKCLCEKKCHAFPEDGFPVNQLIVGLLNQKPAHVSRGESAEYLWRQLGKINIGIYDIENSLSQSEQTIKERCCSLRNEIDILTETALQSIQNQREELLKKVIAYEQECLENLTKNDHIKTELEKSIKNLKEFSKNCQNLFEKHEIDVDECERTIKDSENYLIKINRDKINLRTFMFNDKIMKFKSTDNKLYQLGSFEFENLPSFVDLSKQSCISSKTSGVFTNGILNDLIDIEFLDDTSILICFVNSKKQIELSVYEIINNKEESQKSSRSIVLHLLVPLDVVSMKRAQ